MLQLPPLADLDAVADGAAVYADDTEPDRFYVVPAIPGIRRSGADRRPLLSFVKYRTTAAAPDAAGGFLDLQTELVLPAPPRAALVAALEDRTGGPVRLTDPLYTGGTVELVTLGASMVAAVTGSTHPSLEPGLVASFSLALTRDGAALLWNQLRTDPCPVAVRYAMTMLARFPPATVRVVRAGTASSTADPTGATVRQDDAAVVEVLDWPDSGPASAAIREQLVTWASGLLTGRPESELLLTARSAVQWPVTPQGTIAGLVGETRGFVEADLSDPWFAVLHVDVGLNAVLGRDRIAAVTVRLRYGQQHHDTVFTPDPDGSGAPVPALDPFDVVVDPAIGRTYRYRVEVQFAATSQRLVLPEVDSDTPLLLVSLGEIGWLQREVSAQNVDWEAVHSVQVGIRYGDPAAGVPDQDDVVALDRGTPTRPYERAVHAAVTQPVWQRVAYVLISGQRIETAWTEHRGRLLLVPDVYERVLGVRFTAPGGFAVTAVHTVAVEHTGAGGRLSRRTLTLTADTPAATWALGLLAGDSDAYRFQVTTTARDGTSSVGPWRDGAGSATVPIGPLPGTRLRVEVSADLVDLAASVRLVTVGLTAPGGEPGHVVFLPGRPTTQDWETYLDRGVAALYAWTAEYHLADGSRRSVTGGPTEDPALVLPPAPA